MEKNSASTMEEFDFDFDKACMAITTSMSGKMVPDAIWKRYLPRVLKIEIKKVEELYPTLGLRAPVIVQQSICNKFWQLFLEPLPVPWVANDAISVGAGEGMEVDLIKAALEISYKDVKAALRILAKNSIEVEATDSKEPGSDIKTSAKSVEFVTPVIPAVPLPKPDLKSTAKPDLKPTTKPNPKLAPNQALQPGSKPPMSSGRGATQRIQTATLGPATAHSMASTAAPKTWNPTNVAPSPQQSLECITQDIEKMRLKYPSFTTAINLFEATAKESWADDTDDFPVLPMAPKPDLGSGPSVASGFKTGASATPTDFMVEYPFSS
ncbi:hypothetical protein E0Z10_g3981 [Xylaria hypoxylon]|uniref:Uncharacterized protein n=1 Tax=Xylaria hypoxylon TaxID=37992 RepID=A0A4Z0YXZ1_9PEZI|nr:hypothetical protein E0Z10_g3981 [Xylaria hypoxylon]